MQQQPDSTTLLSDYWLADKVTDKANVFDWLKLQRAVANFVKIVSGRDIPVEFQYHNDKSSIDKIIISSDLSNIDATVGLAVHETLSFIYSYRWCLSKIVTLLTDDYLSARHEKFASLAAGERYKYKNTIRSEIEGIHHLIEFWRLDELAIRTSPGYKGYILASYNKLFNPNLTIELLNWQRNNYYRISYFYLFFCQVAESEHYQELIDVLVLRSQVEAKQELYDQLKSLIRIRDISRLENSEDSLKLAVLVWELIDRYATTVLPEGLVPEKDATGGSLDNEPASLEESEAESFANEYFSSAALNIAKQSIPTDRKEDIRTLFSNTLPSEHYTLYDNRKIRVVVLKEMTRDLIYSGKYPFFETENVHATENAVVEGIRLGKQLARKIAFRNDRRETRFSRLEKGKIDKRLLHTVAVGNQVIFYENREESFPSVNFHLSIDGSHSMSGNCFRQSLKTAVAIAQAADLTKNIRITISFRYHAMNHLSTLPLVLIAYDSKRDKLSKIKQLFRFLKATGPTPEGLCYSTITDLMEVEKNELSENYFINLYDGMPAFIIDDDCVYEGPPAIEHTREEVMRMKRRGIHILSYFIVSEKWKAREVRETFEKFRYMYGKDAEMINLDALGELAKSLNRLILSSGIHAF